MDKAGTAPADITLMIYAAKLSKYDRLVCIRCKSHGCTDFTGHTLSWCILEGGEMAGKTIEESCKACIAHFNKQKSKDKKKTMQLTITSFGGSAFMVEGDSDNIAIYFTSQEVKTTPTAKPEFVGLASDMIPGTATIAEVEALEFDSLIALEKECMIDQSNHNQKNEITLSSLIQPIEPSPFYLDSGVMIHISPNSSNFTSLKPITGHLI